MKKIFQLLLFVLLALSFCSVAFAEGSVKETVSENMPLPSGDEKELSSPEHMFPIAEEMSGSKIEKQRDSYLKKRGWSLGFNKKGTYFGWGAADINIPPNDIAFGQKRITVFEKAFADAKGQYVVAKERETTTSIIRKLFHDDRAIPEKELETKKSRLKLIKDKVVALTEAKLDELLIEHGKDPQEISRLSLTEKHKIASDSISRSIAIKAVQSMAGVRVLATFEDLDQVGILIVCSPEMREVAKAIASGRTVGCPPKRDPKQSIWEQIESKCPGDRDLAFMHGVRVMTDDNGDRALVAFGQWSPKVTRNDSKMKLNMAVKAAREQANLLADGALTDFVNSTLVLENKSTIASSDDINKIISPDQVEDSESSNVGALVDKVIKQNGHARLQGVATVKTWTANHPETGHLLVGHILMWSPATRDAAKGVIPEPESTRSVKKKERTYENKIHESADFDDDADF